MPVFEYGCSMCDYTVDVRHGVHGHGPSTCPVCGGSMRKLLSTPTIVFKGSGWASKEGRSGGSGRSTSGASDSGSSDRGSSDSGSPDRRSSDRGSSEAGSTGGSEGAAAPAPATGSSSGSAAGSSSGD